MRGEKIDDKNAGICETACFSFFAYCIVYRYSYRALKLDAHLSSTLLTYQRTAFPWTSVPRVVDSDHHVIKNLEDTSGTGVRNVQAPL
jgi:hypothetical protein